MGWERVDWAGEGGGVQGGGRGEGVSVRHGYVPPHLRQSGRGTD